MKRFSFAGTTNFVRTGTALVKRIIVFIILNLVNSKNELKTDTGVTRVMLLKSYLILGIIG